VALYEDAQCLAYEAMAVDGLLQVRLLVRRLLHGDHPVHREREGLGEQVRSDQPGDQVSIAPKWVKAQPKDATRLPMAPCWETQSRHRAISSPTTIALREDVGSVIAESMAPPRPRTAYPAHRRLIVGAA
jgi:hypothetical protein